MYLGERFNAYSHLIGAIFAIAALVLMLVQTIPSANAYKITSAAVYGACLIILYVGSTIYHSVRPARAKAILQKFDHCAIYLLIAGSYTPFALITLNGAWGWSIFGVIWGLCLFGIAQELTLGRKTRALSMALYVIMGWLILVAIYPLVKALATGGLIWLVIGGLLYSAGIYWFINDEKIKHAHGIWHLFVLGGSAAQFVSVYQYVLPV